MILAGDVGGTNSRLAVFDDQCSKFHEHVYKNAGRSGLQEIVREFIATVPQYTFDRACFGVAGPVAEGKVTLTNLSWQLDEQQLAEQLQIPKVGLINDLVSHAESIEVLRPERFITLRPGEPVRGGGRAIIAAGTGLGEAGLFYDSKIGRYRAFASEGGHCDFSPRNPDEDRLLQFLRTRSEHPSWESVLSGPGIRNLYDYFCTTNEFEECDRLPNPAPTPADITVAAMNGSSKLCARVIDTFVSLYGSAAGNLALKMLATGGVYLGGGIAPKILERLKSPRFVAAFDGKSVAKTQAVLCRIPIHVINFELGGLYGAANYASRL